MDTISIRAPSMPSGGTKIQRRVKTRLPAALALLPTALIVLIVYIGCMLWTVRLSFTSSTLLPKLDWVGLAQYSRLFANDRFLTSASILTEKTMKYPIHSVHSCYTIPFLGIKISLHSTLFAKWRPSWYFIC
jgi:glucose/mannose transport system permease protein